MTGNPRSLAEGPERRWFRQRVRALLGSGVRGRPTADFLSLILAYPEALPLPRLREGAFFWSHPQAGIRLSGHGVLSLRRVEGAGRFRELGRYYEQLRARWRCLDPDETGLQPHVFLGFSFDTRGRDHGDWRGFPAGLLVLPELLIHGRGERTVLVLSARTESLDPEAQWKRWFHLFRGLFSPDTGTPPRSARRPFPLPTAGSDAWFHPARSALDAIRAGRLEKLVLARRLDRPISPELSSRELLRRIETRFPQCRLFATRQRDRLFIAASPERLVQKRGPQITCDALAGTLERAGQGRRDRILARRLLSTPKLREEQARVEQAIRATLGPLCRHLEPEESPRVQRLHNVQHLWSEIRGTLRDGAPDLLSLAERLHPTPAVAGVPRRAALEWLGRWEPLRRGWYSGLGGFLDHRGDGELAVLLRCALIRGDRASLFAGAGLVAESDPESEFTETQLKLSGLWDLLDDAPPWKTWA